MTSALAIAQVTRMRVGDLMGQAGLPPSVLYGETEIELSVYAGEPLLCYGGMPKHRSRWGDCHRCWGGSFSGRELAPPRGRALKT